MSDINVNIEENGIKACHRFGKLDVTSKSRKAIVLFVNRKSCNKISENKKKLAKLNMKNITLERERKFLLVKA